MKKADFLFIAGALTVAFICAGIYLLVSNKGSKVQISANGEIIGTYSLMEEQEIPIQTKDGYNLLVIEDGAAFMKEADCSNLLCVYQRSISKTGEAIICLPHRVVITVIESNEASLDAVAY